MEEIKIYTMEFICSNCGCVFKKELPFGTKAAGNGGKFFGVLYADNGAGAMDNPDAWTKPTSREYDRTN